MKFLDHLFPEKWQLRKKDVPIGKYHATHYVNGVRAAAINTLYCIREDIENTIYEVCQYPEHRTPTHIYWAKALSRNILPAFLLDNPSIGAKLNQNLEPHEVFIS